MTQRFIAILCLAFLATLTLAPTVPAAISPIPVEAAGFSFTPPVLVVAVGTTIQWNGILFPHTVTTSSSLLNAKNAVANDPANNDGDPDTFAATITGTSFSHTYDVPGDYAYFCKFHTLAGMVGQITVI